MSKNSGCYKCEERVLGCHSNCPKYQAYKLYLENINQKKQEAYKTYPSHRKSKYALTHIEMR